jgi:5-dehydro-2-deoxygluconokinase
MSRPDVVILGRAGYDLIATQPNVPLARVRTFERYLGGSSANMAVGLSRLGARVAFISALGDEGLSDFLVEFLRNEGVDTTHVQRVPDGLPSLALTELHPPDRFPQVYYRQDPADTKLRITPEALDLIAQARLFITNGTSLCASPSRESTYLALERARTAGVRTVLDVDYRPMSWRSPEEAGLAARLAAPMVDILIANDTEQALLGKVQAPMLIDKLGHLGTRVHWEGREIFHPPYQVNVVSSIGAGDGFASGFLYGILQGLPVEECLKYGNAAAAIVVSRLSCSEAMPTLAEIQELMAAQR